MEIRVNDLTLGFAREIDFALVEDGYGQHVPSFRLMQTQDMSSLVITYTWVDAISKYFNGKEEAFYIDGINENNYEEAKKIFINVYTELRRAFAENPNQTYDLESYIMNTYGETRKRNI